MYKRKKSFMMIVAVMSIVALLAGCGSSATNKENGGQGQTTPETSSTPTDTKTGGEVNVYTARHYDVDAELYAKFKEQTGIQVNVIEGKAPELIERMKREGERTSADLFITVDGGILNTAKVEGLLQPVQSEVIDAQVPADLRDKDKEWIGLSTRARVIVYAKDRVNPSELSTYEDLASDKWKGKLLTRSSTSLYNQSLLASLISLNGEQKAEEWASGIVANFARDPEGGDRDQAKAIVAGAGDVAIMNTYYVGAMTVSDDPEEVKVTEKIGVFFPNQETTGTHVNISGAGLVKYSKNKENAVKLIEFLTSPEAQTIFSNKNFEYPVNKEAKLPDILQSWGEFKKQTIDFADYGTYNPKAVEIANKVGWK